MFFLVRFGIRSRSVLGFVWVFFGHLVLVIDIVTGVERRFPVDSALLPVRAVSGLRSIAAAPGGNGHVAVLAVGGRHWPSLPKNELGRRAAS